MIPGFDPAAAQRSLKALTAAIQAFPAERQPAVLREWLELQLDRLEAMEDAHHAYLAECALLAVDNMQDARLHMVEQRLRNLENPDGPTLFEILKQTALTFAFTLAGWYAVELTGVLVLSYFAAAELAAPGARTAAMAADEALLQSARSKVSSLAELQARREALERERSGLATALEALTDPSLPPQVKSAVLRDPTIAAALDRAGAIAAELDAVHSESLIAQLSLTEGTAASVQARLRYERNLISDADSARGMWRRFLDDAMGALALTPAQTAAQLLGQSAARLATPASDAPAGQASPGGMIYLASARAGPVLTAVAEQRRAIRTEYTVLRAGLRSRSDASLITDPLVTQLTGVLAALTPLLDTHLALQDTVRPLLVRGFEAALWWAYLQTSGMLRDPEHPDAQVMKHVLDQPDYQPGDIVNGYLVRSVPPQEVILRRSGGPRVAWEYDTEYYPGVVLLTEGQTEYLYEAFADPYFSLDDHAKTLPFTFDSKKYLSAPGMPPTIYAGFLTNTDRQTRLDQMRLMVIWFFEQLPRERPPSADATARTASEALAIDVSADAWTALFPAATAPSPADPAADGSASVMAEAAAADLAGLLSDSKVLSQTQYEILRSRLAAAVADLDEDIQNYNLVNAGVVTPQASPRRMDEEHYYDVIRREQDEIKKNDPYGQALRAAQQFDPEEADELTATYEAWIGQLTSWTPAPAPSKWKLIPDQGPLP